MSTPPPGPSVADSDSDRPARIASAGISNQATGGASPRNLLFLCLIALSLLVFRTPLIALLHGSFGGDNLYDKYSYTLLIPFLSVALVLFEKEKIFTVVQYNFRSAAILLLAGAMFRLSAELALQQLGADNSLSIQILGLVAVWFALFILCYGTHAFRAGAFSLLLLLFTVPIPDFLLDKPVTAVQYGSTEVCAAVFSIFRIPVLRDGLVFTLPRITILVAKECSGIHSTFAILIVSFIAGHLFLPSAWKRALLVLSALPIVCMTNGLRIAGLALLAEYVDVKVLYGNLHHKGGIGFFLLALVLLFATLHLLKRVRRRPEHTSVKSQ
jgi:exosortase